MKTRKITLCLLLSAMGVTASHTTHATVQTTPASLNPGDPYRLLFVSSPSFRTTGVSTNVNDYNQLANQAAASSAQLNALNTDWFAIVSTPGEGGIDAKINTGTDDTPAGNTGVPIFLVDGTTKIVDHYDDLWDGNIDTRIDVTETGDTPPSNDVDDLTVWTGTVSDGTVNTAQPLGSTFFAGRGEWGQTDSRWIGTFGGLRSKLHSIYVISDVLTVPNSIPLPADLSGDGDVDDEDLGLFFSAFTGPDNGPSLNPAADLSGDGDVDDEDLGIAFSEFTGPLSPASVPEPTSLALLGLGSALIASRYRASR